MLSRFSEDRGKEKDGFVKQRSHRLNFRRVILVIDMQLKTFICSIHKFNIIEREFIRLVIKGCMFDLFNITCQSIRQHVRWHQYICPNKTKPQSSNDDTWIPSVEGWS